LNRQCPDFGGFFPDLAGNLSQQGSLDEGFRGEKKKANQDNCGSCLQPSPLMFRGTSKNARFKGNLGETMAEKKKRHLMV